MVLDDGVPRKHERCRARADEMTYSAALPQAWPKTMATNPDIFVIGTEPCHRGGPLGADKGLVM